MRYRDPSGHWVESVLDIASIAYDLYDIGVNQILLGPIGFIAGVACMVFAAILAIRQMILPAAGVVLGGAFLLKADSVVQTIGALIG